MDRDVIGVHRKKPEVELGTGEIYGTPWVNSHAKMVPRAAWTASKVSRLLGLGPQMNLKNEFMCITQPFVLGFPGAIRNPQNSKRSCTNKCLTIWFDCIQMLCLQDIVHCTRDCGWSCSWTQVPFWRVVLGPLKISDSVSFVSLSKTCQIAKNETLLQGLRHRKPSLHRLVLSVHGLPVLLCLSRCFKLTGHPSDIDETKKTKHFQFFHFS